MKWASLPLDMDTEMRDFMIYLSELFFQLLNGNPLANSPWIFAWIIFVAVLVCIPVYLAVNAEHEERESTYIMIAIVSFFPLLMLAIGPPIVQEQMLQECKRVEVQTADAVFQGETVNLGSITIDQCRVKDNYYNDFGEWKTF